MAAIGLVHNMKTKTPGKVGDNARKLDISKAYDRSDWNYLCDVMLTLGFFQKWVTLIMLYLETVDYFVDYFVIVNSYMVGSITLRRGLGQSDPLSLYFFVICVEGLSTLIRYRPKEEDIFMKPRFVKVFLTFLTSFFANDYFLFFRANENEALEIKNILTTC